MKYALEKYFPMLQSREEVLEKIREKKELSKMFDRWEERRKEEFLDFCTGVKGVKMLYDFCAKAILNPEVYPERIEELISLLLGKKVRLLKVLPNDNTRIADVYTIVLFEKSTSEFHALPDQYIHKFRQKSDTGLQIDLLQEFVFVALDIYREKHQNKNIEERLDGWLTFLISDEPEDIIALIERYPDFKAMYEQIYEICRNIEQVMGMFSKELYELDRNTVRYMIDELQEEYQKQKEKNQKQKEENQRQKEENQRQKEENQKQREEIEYLKRQNERLMKEIEQIKRN